MMRTAWQIETTDILSLQGNSDAFVQLMNALLYVQGRAGGLLDTALQFNQKATVPDGGVDAVVAEGIVSKLDPTGRFAMPTCWQFKAQPTSNIKSRKGKGGQMAALRQEINKPYAIELIKKGYGYRFCIADDMPANAKTKWEGWLTEEAKKLNPATPAAQVVTASDLMLWINRYPSVALRIQRVASTFETFDNWQSEVRALTNHYVKVADWDRIDAVVRNHVDFNTRITTILTVQGEAGVGKTRTIFEMLATDPALAALVVATNDEQSALEFTQDVAGDKDLKAILVADECSLEYREKLRRLVPGCADRLRVVAIDNTLQRAGMDGEIRITQLAQGEVYAVLDQNFSELPPDRRRSFAHLAGGFVRLAVDLCQHDGLIPADGRIDSIFGFFHDSYLKNRLADQDRAAVELISLLPRVGYRGDVVDQLERLCSHPHIKLLPKAVIEIANKLKQSPGFIAFGGRFLYITPKLIAQVAFQSAWDRWVSHDPERFLNDLAPELLDGFMERVRNAPDPTLAETVSGFFVEWATSLSPLDLGNEAKVIRLTRLVEIQPDLFLPILQGLLERTAPHELQQLHSGELGGHNARRQLVWLGEKLSHLPDTFAAGEDLLLKLALAETERHLGNSASRVWAALYRIVLSGTPVPFGERLHLLEQRLREAKGEQIPLALAAFDEILTDGGPVMGLAVPPIVLGRIPPPAWRPVDEAERQACRQTGLRMGARIAAESGPVAEAIRAAVVNRISALLLADNLNQVEAILGPGPLPDDLSGQLTRKLEDFFDTFCREHVINVRRPQSNPDGVQETVTVPRSIRRKVGPAQESRIKGWYRKLMPETLHGRLVSVVGQESWHQELGGDKVAWQKELDSLAAELLRNPVEFDRELSWLASDEARSGFHLGHALGRTDAEGVMLDRIFHAAVLSGATGLARGYLDRVIACHPLLLGRVNTILDRLEADHPRLAFDVVWSAGDSVRKVERLFAMVDRKAIPTEFLRGLESDIYGGQLSKEHLIGALERCLVAAESGNEKAGEVAIRLLDAWLRPVRQAAGTERLQNDDILKALLRRLLSATADAVGHDPTFWMRLAADLAVYDPESAIEFVIRAMTNRNLNTRNLAQNSLIEMAGKYPRKMMTPLGEALLNPETSQWLGMANISGLIQAIPEDSVRNWIEQNGADGARVIARHLHPPFIDDAGKPVVSPLTAFVLERFETNDRVYQEFSAGTHAGRSYSGDIAAEYEREGKTALQFVKHPLRRIREWAKDEIIDARKWANHWHQRDEEDQTH